MEKIVDGKKVARDIENDVRNQAEAYKKATGHAPKLGVILVGDHKPSHLYVRKKQEAAERVGIEFVRAEMSEESTTKEVVARIQELQQDKHLSGLIVQLPLPKHIDTDTVIDAIDPSRDVDCMTELSMGKLVHNTLNIAPPTAGAIDMILKSLPIDLKGLHITIVGTGPLVGKPLAIMLMNEEATVTTCNIHTKDLRDQCRMADILISGTGKAHLINKKFIKKGAIVIDAGVAVADGKPSGDVDVESVIKKAAYVTPTPGGVGPITVSRLLLNTVLCAKQ